MINKNKGFKAVDKRQKPIRFSNVQIIIPAGEKRTENERYYQDENWVTADLTLTEDELTIRHESRKDFTIALSNIYYIDRKIRFTKANSLNVLNFNYSASDGRYLALIKTPSKKRLKKYMLRYMIKNTKLLYMSNLGSRSFSEKKWRRGIFHLDSSPANSIIIYDIDNDQSVSEINKESIFRLERCEINGEESLRVDYWNDSKHRCDLLLPSEISITNLEEFFNFGYLKIRKKKFSLHTKEKILLDVLSDLEKRNQDEYPTLSDCKELIGKDELNHSKLVENTFQLNKKGAIETIDVTFELTNSGKKALEDDLIEKSEEVEKEYEDVPNSRRDEIEKKKETIKERLKEFRKRRNSK